MKKLFTLLSIISFNLLFSQLLTYEVRIVEVQRTNYSDCGGCGSPDPTWIMSATDNGSGATTANVQWCYHFGEMSGTSWGGHNDLMRSKAATNATTITLQFEGFEKNRTGGNDCVFGSGTSWFGNDDNRRCINNNLLTINFRDQQPCTDNFYWSNWCGDFRYRVRVTWSWVEAPTIVTQPTPNQSLCLGQSPSPLSVVVNSATPGGSLGRFYQWQVSTSTACDGTGWVNIPGATSATYTPPATQGTRLYRVLVTSNCTNNFNSNTVVSGCSRVTINPAPTPTPAIQSSACGSTILPNQSVNFAALLPPAVGAVANNTGYAWTVVPSAGVTINIPNGSSTNISFANPGSYTVTLTYLDNCPNPDATSTCTINVSQPDCDFIYVDWVNGNDLSQGGPNGPVRTLGRAMELVSASRRYIRMTGASYTETRRINISSNLIIEGGYVNTGGVWTKASNSVTNINFTNNTAVNGTVNQVNNQTRHLIAFSANGVSNWSLIDLNVTTSAVTGTATDGHGSSNYALWMNNASNYNIIRCGFNAGAASAGANGINRPKASNGNAGLIGSDGHCDNNLGTRPGGAGGAAVGTGIRTGGAGGLGGQGSSESSNNNTAGAVGSNGGGGAAGGSAGGGTGANGGCGTDCNRDGRAGGNGSNGANGANASTVAPATNNTFGIYWIPNGASASGSDGAGGGGGRGGGGGGRQSGTLCDNGPGSGGGGGGSGGEGGQAGTGGFGGGGSFGIYRTASNAGANITQVNFQVAAVANGGAGGLGGDGGDGGVRGLGGGGNNVSLTSGGSVTGGRVCNNCEVGAGGSGGFGGAGGRGGNGQPGAQGRSNHMVTDGVVSNPSATFTPPTVVTIAHNNTQVCSNSEINISRATNGTWGLPSGASFINNVNSSTSTFTTASNSATITLGNAGVLPTFLNLTTNGANYQSYLVQTVNRNLPVIGVSPLAVCSGTGSEINLTATSWGTEVEFEWHIFTTNANSPLITSSLQNPAINTSGLAPATYNVRYRVREQCCGWSAPVYLTFQVVTDPTAPNPLVRIPNENEVCVGAVLTIASATGSTGGAGSCVYEYRFFNPGTSLWTAWGTTIPNTAATGTGTAIMEARRNCDGSGCDLSPIVATSWEVVAQPTAGLPVRVLPVVNTVCIGETLTAAATAGIGGTGVVTTELRWRLGVSGAWTTYTGPFVANALGDYYFQTRRVTNGFACNASSWEPAGNGELLWTVIDNPIAPVISKLPNDAQVCAGALLSVSSFGGSGGAGTCNNEYRFSTNNGSTWSAWDVVIPSFNAVVGTNLVQARRFCSGGGSICNSNITEVSWIVIPDPVAPSITRSPNLADVCTGASLTVAVLPGSGGSGTCTDEYRFSTDNGLTFSAWNTIVPNLTAVTGTTIIESRRNCNGSGCDSNVNQVSWNVLSDPVAPAITKNPNVAELCEGITLTVSAVSGSGGVGSCADEYRFSTDNGITWSSWGTSLPSFSAVTGVNIVQSRRNCSGNGCDSNINQVSWDVIANPVAPVLVKVPNVAELCEGSTLTVSSAGGSGGSGTCVNEYRFSTDNGVTWSLWTSTLPSFSAVTGVNIIEARRNCTGLNCNSNINSVSWNVVAQPLSPSVTKVPNSASVCNNELLSINVVAGSGGSGTCSDEYRFSTNNGATWSAWSNSIPSFNAVTGTNIIEARRNCDGLGCASIVEVVSWNVVDNPVISSVSNTNVLCFGNSTASITINSPNSVQYSIDSGATYQSGSTFTGLPAGQYNIVIRNSTGCETFFTSNPLVITQPALLELSSNVTDPSCDNTTNGVIVSVPTGGVAPYEFSLNGGPYQSNGTFSNLGVGTYSLTVRDNNFCITSISVTLSPQYTFELLVDSIRNVGCPGSADGYVELAVVGGQSPFQYSSNNINFSSSPVFENLVAGSYTFFARDVNGCTDAISVNVVESAPVQVDVDSVIHIACNGDNTGAIYISPRGSVPPYSYEWRKDGVAISNSQDLVGITAGVYNVTVSTSNSCQTTISVQVTEPPRLSANVNSTTNATCNGGTGSIEVNVTGGTPSYTFVWEDALNNVVGSAEDLNGVPAGTYTLTVTDANNCITTVSGTITEPGLLSATASLSNPTCAGTANGSITVNASSGTAPYTFSLNGGAAQSNNSFANLAAGTYTIVVRDANNCSFTLTETLVDGAAFTLNVSSQTNVSCSGQNDGSVTLTTTGGQLPIEYSSNGINYQASNVFNNLPAGLYTFYARDINGCAATVSATISSNPPLVLTLNSTTNVLCNGDATGAISVSATGGQTPYEFSINGGTPQATGAFTGLTAGSYNILVEDANNCTQTLSVTISQPTVLTSVVVGVSNALCNGGTGSIEVNVTGGTPSYTFVWEDALNNVVGNAEDLNGVPAGTYTLTVTDANNCTTTVSGTITEPGLLSATAVLSNPTCAGTANGSITVNASSGTAPYTFSLNGGAAQSNNSFANLAAGTYTIVVRDANNCSFTLTETLVDGAAFTLNVSSQTNVSCSGQNDGSVTLTTTGGQSPIEYSSNGINYQASNVFNNLPAGLYTFYARDINGCAASVSTTISSNPPLVVVVENVEDVLCNSQNTGSIEISVTGGSGTYTYAWSNSSTSQNLVNVGAGTYNVVVTDGNGCTANASATISQPTLLSASIASVTDVSCNGASNGAIQVNVTGGTTPYSFAWSNTATTQNISNLTAGIYSLTIEDANGCFVTVSATVNQPGVLTATAVLSNPTCAGTANGSITVNASSGTAPYTFSLNGGAAQSNNSFANLAAGTYTIVVRDANNCSFTLTETLVDGAAFTLNVSSQTNVSCSGQNDGSVTLTTTGGQTPIEYSSNGINYQASNVFNNLPAGLYTFYARDINGCAATVSATISSNPPLVVVVENVEDVLCNSQNTGSIEISVTGGSGTYTYSWSNSSTSQNLVNVGAGTYNVVVTDGNGCTANASATISQPTLLSASIASVTDVSCNGASNGAIQVNVTGGTTPYSFAWSNTATTQNISNLTAGIYSLTIEDANGCFVTVSATVNQPGVLTATAVLSNPTCGGTANGSITVNASSGTAPYTFSLNGGAAQSNNSFANLAAGSYTIVVRDANNCSFTLTETLVDGAAFTLNVSSQTNVSCSGQNDGSVTLTTTGGQTPIEYSSNGINYQASNVFNNLPAGLYTFYARDINGCAATVSATISSNPPLVLSLNNTGNVLCHGNATGSITVTATGGQTPYTFSLNGGTPQATGTFIGLTAGSYNVVVEDANGCSESISVNISQPNPLALVIAAFGNASCSGANSGFVDVSVGGGVTPYSFSWSNGTTVISTSEDISGLGAGTYTLTVTDGNGCIATIAQTITIPAPLTGNLVTTNENCFGDGTGTATANINGGTPPYTYLWSTFDTSATVTGLQSGTISVIVRDSNGCELFLTGTISGPAAPLTITLIRKSDVTCFGGSDGSILTSITGGTPPYTISWSSGSSTTNQADDLPAGFHTITVQDANGCITSASFTINQPPQIITSVSVTNPTCFGNATGMALIGASGGNPPFTYEWNTTPVQTGALANNLAGDTSYIVKITDSRGCEVFDTAHIVYPDPISITTIPTSVSCLTAANGEVAVEVTGGNAPYTYQLNGFMQVDSVFEGLDIGTYIVFVVDNNNCSAYTQFEIDGASTLEIDLVGAGNTGVFQTGQLFVLRGEEVQLDVELVNFTGNNIVEYIWTPANVDLSGCTDFELCQNPVISPVSTVWVIVEVVEEINGSFCVVRDSLLIDVSQEARVFIPTAFSPNKDPDCINEHFEINILGATNLDVRIFNRWGEEVFHNPNQQNGPTDPSDLNCSNPRNAWDGSFKGKPVPIGSYVYQIEVTYFDSTKEYISGTITVIR